MSTELLHAVEASIPASIRDNYDLFVDLIKLYYKNLYTKSDAKKITELHRYIVGDENLDGYIDKLMQEIGIILPISSTMDNKTLVIYVLNFILKSRGSEASIKAFFRLLFNEEVLITHPRKLLFYTSNTQNIITKTHLFKCDKQPIGNYYSFNAYSSNIQSDIESISYFRKDDNYYIVVDAYTTGDLKIGERIDLIGEHTIICSNEGLYTTKIINSGQYYQVGDVVSFYDATVKGEYQVASVSTGTIESLSIEDAGAGYSVGDIVMSEPNNGFFAKVSSVDNDGAVLSIDIKNKGRAFSYKPAIIIRSSGTGAKIDCVTKDVGSITSMKVLSAALLKNSDVFKFYSNYGAGAVLSLELVSAYQSKNFMNNNHKIGINNVILDSEDFHEHSYNIISETDLVLWKDYFERYLHRSGYVYNHINPITLSMNYTESFTSEVIE